MKRVLIFILIAAAFFSCRKDTEIESGPLPFVHFYGGNGDETGRQVKVLPNGNIVACGYGAGPNGANDFFLLCTDNSGEEKWRRYYGGSGDEICWSFDRSADGGFIIGGYSNSSGSGGDNFFIVKTDSAGQQEWTKTSGGAYGEVATHIRTLPDGYLLSGIRNSGNDDNAFVLKLDLAGDSVWGFSFGGNGGDGAMYSIAGENNSHIVIGYTNSTISGGTDGFLLSLNENGEELFHYNYGTPEYDEPHAVAKAVDGDGWVISGHYGSAVTISTHHVFMTAVGNDGTERWHYTYGGAQHDGSEEMVVADHSYAIVARSNSRAGTAEDFYFLRVNANGSLRDERWLGTDADDAGYGIAFEGNSFVLCGTSRGGPFGGKDIYLQRIR